VALVLLPGDDLATRGPAARHGPVDCRVAVREPERVRGRRLSSLGNPDEILTLLTRVGDLRVSSRHSTSRFAGLAIPAREIGRELGVSYLLDGSVQRSGDTVRVHVALLDAEEDENVWAASYERNASEVFAIESEVAQTVARALQVRLTAKERTA
jgi:adenylate cyclase